MDNVPSTSRQVNSSKYHVFLSFRGSDTRNNFTAHLYERLQTLGFDVYRDDKKMIKGEEINEDLKKAISNSTICIPIFSRTYASSKACLRELCQMIESKNKIIPIFYDVTPDDVNLKTLLYTSAIEEHRHSSKIDLDEVNKWENALTTVAEKAGYVIINKNEAEEITSITKELVDKLMPKHQDVTNHLVEVDNEMHCIATLLDLNSSGFRIIGVFGMGGIGKTTLAKLIFNRYCPMFPGCCSFLENVTEKLESNRLLELQRQLYNDIIDSSLASSIVDPNDGINKIKKGLEKQKFLLVLDDMDSATQLVNLVGHHVSFASGSRVIITTRNKGILDYLKHDMDLHVYELKEMDNDRAVKLFSRNAFRRDFPPDEFQALTKQVVSYASGLPLALEVFGSLLCGKNKEIWEEKLEELQNSLDSSIQNRLMISYQGLKSNEKKIFLDIACYRGEIKKMHAFYMWKDCGWFPESAIKTLKDHSLVKVIVHNDDDDEILWMHDIFKDVGRTIIQEESDKRGGIPSRLQFNESLEKLHEKKAKICVEMLSISNATVTRKDMAGLCKLRFLELRCCRMMGNFKDLHFPDLRWLSLTNVSDIGPCWEEWCTIKANKLKVLYLDAFKYSTSEMPFTRFPGLEVLIIDGGIDLTKTSISIRELKNLTQLSIQFSPFYVSVGMDWIGNLTSLCKLILSDADITELPDSIGRLKQLKELRVTGYYLERVSELPSSLTHLCIESLSETMQVYWSSEFKLMNIVKLKLWCECVEPKEDNYLNFEWIRNARNLEKLCLHIPYIILNLEKVSELSLLKHLEVSFVKFQYLRLLPSSLLHLELHQCELVTKILDVSDLKNLILLKISKDDKLEEIKGLGGLHSLHVSRCSKLRNIHAPGSLNRLESLTLFLCPSLECLPNLSKSRKLRRVGLVGCNKLRDIQHSEELKSLEYVYIAQLRLQSSRTRNQSRLPPWPFDT